MRRNRRLWAHEVFFYSGRTNQRHPMGVADSWTWWGSTPHRHGRHVAGYLDTRAARGGDASEPAR